MMVYLAKRRVRKRAKEILHHARHIHNFREDLMSRDELAGLETSRAALHDAIRSGTPEAMEKTGGALAEHLSKVTPRKSFPSIRENIEVIVVAVAVAMAFRTYFIQPFKIPTGSMQPTLYGITSVTRTTPKLLDRKPLQYLRWAVTGELYRAVKAKAPGTLQLARQPSGMPYINPNYPGDFYYTIAGHRYRIPRGAPLNVRLGDHVPKGGVIWAGSRTAGDHVFVDKVSWNFRRPKRGEIMVFSTRGIDALESSLPRDRKGQPMSTHYIKRMSGMPGDQLAIVPPEILIDGEPLTEPATMRRIADRAEGYSGYRVAQGRASSEALTLTRPGQTIQLGDAEYFALGDNTGNSRDSRYWGPVARDNLVGPACMIYWPFGKRWGRAR